MSIFDTMNQNAPADINEESDSLGGFSPLETALYGLTIDLAFVTMAQSKAMCLNVHFSTDNKQGLRQQFYVTSGEAKGCKNFYQNAKGEKFFLPGFNQANALCLLTLGKPLGEMVTEVKTINLYDHTVGKEVPTNVEMITALIGQKVIGGVIKQIEDKNKKNDETGEYEATGETRTVNEVDKFFRERDGMTVPEIKAQAIESVFKQSWADKWTGQVKDKSSGVTAPAGGSTGATNGSPAAPKASTLFA